MQYRAVTSVEPELAPSLRPAPEMVVRPEARQDASLQLQSQLLDFIIVILAIEDRPFLGALNDGATLAFDFLASGLIDASLLHEKLFENLSQIEAARVAVLDELDLIHVSDSVGDNMGELVDFVADQSLGRGVLKVVLKEYPCIFLPS